MNKVEVFEKQIDECNKIIEIVKEIKENAQKEISELKKDKKEKWRPFWGEFYFYYSKDMNNVYESRFCNSLEDNQRVENGLIYKTKAEAVRYANYQKVKKEYTYEFSKEEWEKAEIAKWAIEYDNTSEDLNIGAYSYMKLLGTLYFKTNEQAQEFIDKYKNEILEYEFGITEE